MPVWGRFLTLKKASFLMPAVHAVPDLSGRMGVLR